MKTSHHDLELSEPAERNGILTALSGPMFSHDLGLKHEFGAAHLYCAQGEPKVAG